MAAPPVGHGHPPLVSQAAKARDTVFDGVGQAALGHQFLEGPAHFPRNAASCRGQIIHLLPEKRWVVQLVESNLAQPLVPFSKHEWTSARTNSGRISFQDGVAGATRKD